MSVPDLSLNETAVDNPTHRRSYIRVRELTYVYDRGAPLDQGALKDVNLDVNRGEFLAIVGANGSGKSTLIRHFNGLLTPTKGTVLVDGMDTLLEENLWSIRQRVGMVFQNPDNQIVSSLVEEDVAFGVENLGLPSQEVRQRVDQALALTGLTEFSAHAPHLLSGGQKQRLAIAGVLAMQPDCLVLDEPSSMLDPAGRRELMDILLELNRTKGVTVILATHAMEEAVLAHRVLVMHDGELVLGGSPVEVFKDEVLLAKVGLELPFAVKITQRLRSLGLFVPEDMINPEDLVAYICR